jgi:pyruvate formate lyase activating enzyme
VRDWFTLKGWNLDEHGRCRRCGNVCSGVFEEKPGTWGAKRVPVSLADMATENDGAKAVRWP